MRRWLSGNTGNCPPPPADPQLYLSPCSSSVPGRFTHVRNLGNTVALAIVRGPEEWSVPCGHCGVV